MEQKIKNYLLGLLTNSEEKSTAELGNIQNLLMRCKIDEDIMKAVEALILKILSGEAEETQEMIKAMLPSLLDYYQYNLGSEPRATPNYISGRHHQQEGNITLL